MKREGKSRQRQTKSHFNKKPWWGLGRGAFLSSVVFAHLGCTFLVISLIVCLYSPVRAELPEVRVFISNYLDNSPLGGTESLKLNTTFQKNISDKIPSS
jgi:hypothetical protein